MPRLRPRPAVAEIGEPTDDTTIDAESGAVRSVQAADLLLPVPALDSIWTPTHLERLARTYWRFLGRVTLGLIRVRYSAAERQVVALGVVPLLTFQAPEYEMDAGRGVVRWRIERGILVSRRGRGGSGYLEIDVQRCPSGRPGLARAHVEVEVANFYPSIASAVGRWIYRHTQSRIHVIVTRSFLRSLARLDLAESRVGRFDGRVDDVPDPDGPRPSERHDAAV